MNKKTAFRTALLAIALMVPACNKPAVDVTGEQTRDAAAAPAATAEDVSNANKEDITVLDPSNVYASASKLPYGIVDFSKLKSEHFLPALRAGMEIQRREIEAIASNPEPATFDNTLVALEKSGRLLTDVASVFFELTHAKSDPVIKDTEKQIVPELSALEDAMYLNDRLFGRIDSLYTRRGELGLDAESLRLLEVYHRDFVRAGAKLAADKKAEISSINAELAQLTTEFGQSILAEKNDSSVVVDDAAKLRGFSESQIQAAAEAAKAKGLEGKYLIELENTSIQPALKQLEDRDVRKMVFEASLRRGTRGNEYDNRARAIRIAVLRAKKAELLGYKDWASYKLEDQTAGTSAAVNEMLGKLVPAAKASLEREAAELQALIDEQGGGFKLESWDWLYYAEQLRRKKYAIDDEALKPYFELNNVIENGVFYAANRVYGLKFVERKDIPTFDDGQRVWEIQNEDGTPISLFFGDYYARDSKLGGAWMNDYILQSKLLGRKPVISNQINIRRPAPGQKTLLTFDQVTTMFHEFGHAMHGSFSNVMYPKFSGTNVPRDFVEFPSQFNETWAFNPEILANYAVNTDTGEKIPQELLDKVIASAQFNQGYMTSEYLAASILDQAWHQKSSEELAKITPETFDEFEHSALAAAGMDLAIAPPRYRSTYFTHIFSNGYSAGYYAYIWSEVLDADAEQWFKEHGLSRANGDHFRNTLLSRGYTEDPGKLYRDFAGRDPQIDPLLVRRGLK